MIETLHIRYNNIIVPLPLQMTASRAPLAQHTDLASLGRGCQKFERKKHLRKDCRYYILGKYMPVTV